MHRNQDSFYKNLVSKPTPTPYGGFSFGCPPVQLKDKTMRFTTNTEIDDIRSKLITRTLPKPDWTHAAHFAAAISMLADPNENPFTSLPGIIREYNIATGVENTDTDGYHHTITLASLLAADHILDMSPNKFELFEITNRLLNSKYGKSDWVLEYWTKPVLFSVEARRAWMAPNLKPLPFPISKLGFPKTP